MRITNVPGGSRPDLLSSAIVSSLPSPIRLLQYLFAFTVKKRYVALLQSFYPPPYSLPHSYYMQPAVTATASCQPCRCCHVSCSIHLLPVRLRCLPSEVDCDNEKESHLDTSYVQCHRVNQILTVEELRNLDFTDEKDTWWCKQEDFNDDPEEMHKYFRDATKSFERNVSQARHIIHASQIGILFLLFFRVIIARNSHFSFDF